MSAKKALLAVVVVFLGFWMFTDPGGLAERRQGGRRPDLGAGREPLPGRDPVLRSAALSPLRRSGRRRHRPAPPARGGRGHRRRGPPPLGRLRRPAAGVARWRCCCSARPPSSPSTSPRSRWSWRSALLRPRRLGLPPRAPRPLRHHQHAGVPDPRGAVDAAGHHAAAPDPRHHGAQAASTGGCSASGTSSSSRPPRSRDCATSATSAAPTSATSPSSASCSARASAARGWSTRVRPCRPWPSTRSTRPPGSGDCAGPASRPCTPSPR